MLETKRVIVPGDDPDTNRIILAVHCTDKICKECVAEDVVLLMPTRASLESEILSASLGPKIHQTMLKGGVVKLASEVPMRYETAKTLKWLRRQSVVMVAHATQTLMYKVDALRNLTAVVAVPDDLEELFDWQRAWAAQVLGQAPTMAAKLMDDPVVEQGLKTLSKMINHAHNELHPRDATHAEYILSILRSYKHKEPARNVGLWAIRNGWLPVRARELEVIAKRVFGLRARPKLEDGERAAEMYRRWCVTAAFRVNGWDDNRRVLK